MQFRALHDIKINFIVYNSSLILFLVFDFVFVFLIGLINVEMVGISQLVLIGSIARN